MRDPLGPLRAARPRRASWAAIARELRDAVGAAHVLESPGDVLAYEYDASNLTAVPDLVVLPATEDEVAAVLRVASRHRVPVVPRGAGTGIAGGALPVVGGIVVALTRMNRILSLDLDSGYAIVEPGVTNIDITRAAAGRGYFYAPDPSRQYASSIGGNVGHNSGGAHTIAYGVTTNHVLGLEVVLASGERVRLGGPAPDAPG